MKTQIVFITFLTIVLNSCEKLITNDQDAFQRKPSTLKISNDVNTCQYNAELYDINVMLQKFTSFLIIKMLDSEFKNEIENLLIDYDKDYINLMDINDNDFNNIPLVEYKGIKYTGGLLLYNKNNCNLAIKPVIAVGIEATNDISDKTNNIYGYFFDETGVSEFLINEYVADTLKNPLYIINPVSINIELKKTQSNLISYSDVNNSINCIVQSINTESMNIYFQALDVNHRYESDNYSEVYIAHYYLEEELNWMYYMPAVHSMLGSIHKNNIPGTFVKEYKMRLRDNNNSYDRPLKLEYGYELAIVTYEYDWYAAKKSVFVTPNGPVIKCKMALADEFYQAGSIIFNNENWPVGHQKIISDVGNAYFSRYINDN